MLINQTLKQFDIYEINYNEFIPHLSLLSLSVNDKIVQQYNHTHKGVLMPTSEKQQTENKTHMLKKTTNRKILANTQPSGNGSISRNIIKKPCILRQNGIQKECWLRH